MNKNNGFSIIEVLITLLLGSLMMIEVYRIYQVNLQTHHTQKAVAEVQRNARFAMNNITQTIHSTGFAVFFGSLSKHVESLLSVKNDVRWDIQHAVIGYDNVASSDTIAGISNFTAGSDVVIVKQTADPKLVIDNPNDFAVVVDQQADYKEGDLLLLTNINNASLFQVSAVSSKDGDKWLHISSTGTPGNSEQLTHDYSFGSDISRLQSVAYFLKSDVNEHGHNRPSLYKAIFSNQTVANQMEVEEVASNVMDFQAIYGIDLNDTGRVEEYKTANLVTDWSKVISVGLSVVVASDAEIQSMKKTNFQYNMVDYRHEILDSDKAVADKRIKKAFHTFVDLKNRIM